MIRGGAVALIAAAALILGAVQIRSSLVLAGLAQGGSWMRLVPEAAREGAAASLDGGIAVPEALRLAVARRSLAQGDLHRAAREASRLRQPRDRLALAGAIAERQGDLRTAVGRYVDAGDGADVERIVGAKVAGNDLDGAIALQRSALQRMSADPLQVNESGEAWWRLGQLYEDRALSIADPVRQTADRRGAVDAYGRALALAPLSMKYQLAVANGDLNLDDPASAKPRFEAVLRQAPDSIDALAGLADASLRLGDRARARELLDRAERLGAGAQIDSLRRRLGL